MLLPRCSVAMLFWGVFCLVF